MCRFWHSVQKTGTYPTGGKLFLKDFARHGEHSPCGEETWPIRLRLSSWTLLAALAHASDVNKALPRKARPLR